MKWMVQFQENKRMGREYWKVGVGAQYDAKNGFTKVSGCDWSFLGAQMGNPDEKMASGKFTVLRSKIMVYVLKQARIELDPWQE